MASDYIIDIEIDEEAGTVTITKESGYTKMYAIEELFGSGIISKAEMANADVTVYAQSEQFTLDEFNFFYGEDLRRDM